MRPLLLWTCMLGPFMYILCRIGLVDIGTYVYYAIISLAYLFTYMFYIEYYLFTSLPQLFATAYTCRQPPPP